MNLFKKGLFASAVLLASAGANAELIGYWSGDGNTNDMLGLNNGSLTNDATYAQGHINQAFLFDGDEDAVFLGTELDVTDAFTVSAWFNTTTDSSSEQQIFNNESAFEVAISNDIIKIAVKTDTTNWYWIYTDFTVNVNEWTYVSMTYDGSSLNLYDEDGNQRFHQAYNGLVLNGSEVRIGARGGNNHSFNGMIDEVSLYDTALNGSDIQSIALSATALTSVPLPATGMLLGLGGLAFLRRKNT